MVGGRRRPIGRRSPSTAAGAGAGRSPSTAAASHPPSTGAASSTGSAAGPHSPSTVAAAAARPPSAASSGRSPSTAAASHPPSTAAASSTGSAAAPHPPSTVAAAAARPPSAASGGRSPSTAAAAAFRSPSTAAAAGRSSSTGAAAAPRPPSTLAAAAARPPSAAFAFDGLPTATAGTHVISTATGPFPSCMGFGPFTAGGAPFMSSSLGFGLSASGGAHGGSPAGAHGGSPAGGHGGSAADAGHGGSPSTLQDMLQSSGGFFNPSNGQNTHFVGGLSHFGPVNEPRQENESVQVENESVQVENEFIQVESNDGNEDARTEKRMLWTQAEDVKVMSVWLKHSVDSISGNFKKSEKYWGDVVEEYNVTTDESRWRTKRQVKERWHKINRLTNAFHDAWLKVRRIYTSGYSDDMWLDKAHRMYEEDNQGPRFVLMDVWYMVRDQAKWIAYNNKPAKGKEVGNGKAVEDIFEDVELPRLKGQKRAKRDAHEAKGKSKDSAIDVDLDKFEQIQNDCHTKRMKVLEI